MVRDAPAPKGDGLPQSFGGWIKQLRETLGMTQGELAKRAEISPAMVSHIESDRRQLGDDLLPKFAKALDQDPDELAKVQTAGVAKNRFADDEQFGSFWKIVLAGATEGAAFGPAGAVVGAAVTGAAAKGVPALFELKQRAVKRRTAKDAGQESQYKVFLDTSLLAGYLKAAAPPPEGRMRAMVEVVQALSELDESELNKVSGFISALTAAKRSPADLMRAPAAAIDIAASLIGHSDE